MNTGSKSAEFINRPSAGSIRKATSLVLGVDGGGTKTVAVVADAERGILSEGHSGPSNPLRVGIANAAAAIREAVDRACDSAGVRRGEIAAAEVGLAGVRRQDLRARMRESLAGLGVGWLEVVTDSDIALFGATDGQPGVVVIAGTGSVCFGVNELGQHYGAGGWGPLAGDEGSGLWIAQNALRAVARAVDGRGRNTSLSRAACAYFKAARPEDLSVAVYAPTMTNDRIAGFGKCVIEEAAKRDEEAIRIAREAGHELGLMAAAVIRGLHLEDKSFLVAYIGGVFRAGDIVLDPLRAVVKQTAPAAFLGPPALTPVFAAVRMAHAHLNRLALTG